MAHAFVLLDRVVDRDENGDFAVARRDVFRTHHACGASRNVVDPLELLLGDLADKPPGLARQQTARVVDPAFGFFYRVDSHVCKAFAEDAVRVDDLELARCIFDDGERHARHVVVGRVSRREVAL